MELSIAPDPLTTVPWGPATPPSQGGVGGGSPPSQEGPGVGINTGQAQVPGTAYIATLTNTSSTAHTFLVRVVPDGFPAEWLILGGVGRAVTTTVTLAPGGVGNLGVYVAPGDLETLPPAGTVYPFTVHATATGAPSLTRSASATFVMPPIPFACVTAQPALVYATPGGEATFDVGLRNVGNVAGEFPLAVTVPISPWVVSNLRSPVSIPPGDTVTQTVHLSTPSGDLGRDYRLRVGTVCGAYRPAADMTVRLVGPNALAVYRAEQETVACMPGDPILPLVLDYLGATGRGRGWLCWWPSPDRHPRPAGICHTRCGKSDLRLSTHRGR